MAATNIIFPLVLTVIGVSYNSFAYELCGPLKSSGPINASLPVLANNQPLFVNFITNLGASPLLKSICFTLFPVANNPDNYQIYKARSYTNGTLEIMPSIGTEQSCGTFANANHKLNEIVHTIGYVEDCRTFVLCTNAIYGVEPSYCFGISPDNQPISEYCLESAFSILKRNLHIVVKHVTIEKTDTTTCITSQSCSVYDQ